MAMLQEATMPKVRKNRTKRMGKGILSIEQMVFLDKTKPARLLAMKVESTKFDSVQSKAKMMKAAVKTAFCLTKAKAGDQKPRPAMKIPATTRLTRPLRV